MSGYRLENGGLIDRSKRLNFTFDGKRYGGFSGDTLASALLANGVSLFGRSFKYHRPRGVYSAGPEEPNALVTLRSGGRSEPNTKATVIELYEGLQASSQNRWPNLQYDLLSINQIGGSMLVAGFYYKTFMGPTRKAWMLYEHFIRKAAGLGAASKEADPDRHEKSNLFCDVLVVGAGPAGLAAALAAGRAGARVVLADENAQAGGALLSEQEETIDGLPAQDWVAQSLAELAALPDVSIMPRTTVYGYYDHNVLGAVERVADHLATPNAHQARQKHWTIRCASVVLATGAIERPIVFDGNDKPGVMLADSARRFAQRQGVAVGRQVVVFTNNDSAYRAALDLKDAGVEIAAIVDPRGDISSPLKDAVQKRGIRLLASHVVTGAKGSKSLKTVEIAPFDPENQTVGESREWIAADSLAVSGGWTPTIHLASQAGGKPVFNAEIASFVPGEALQNWHAAGACNGDFALEDCLSAGANAGAVAARDAGFASGTTDVFDVTVPAHAGSGSSLYPLWEITRPNGPKGKKFVDLQHDVTAEDVRLAQREGFESVEHLKRYTTLGMAADQGKTSNVNGLALMAAALERSIPEVGTTRFRPPYTPVALGALAGRETGFHISPVRRTPMHDLHVKAGADMLTAGQWMRPQVYRKSGEDVFDAYVREARTVREGVGMVDVSTLGKIDVQGPDAQEFLNRVYSNGFKSLPVGKARYGLMLREDGCLFDDGTTWCLGETQYLMTTTTANAAGVLSHLEFLLATVWPEMRVQVTSVTEQWAGVAVAGPKSRALLQSVIKDLDLSDEGVPFMGVYPATLEDIPVLVARLSFSGELAYEVYAGSNYGAALWEKLILAGEAFGLVPYGTEALGTLRIEKGHVAGPELDGRTTARDLGLGGMTSSKKHYIGRPLMEREALNEDNRQRLVGVISSNGTPLSAGSHLVEGKTAEQPGRSLGHVSSTTYSPAIDKFIALALLEGGLETNAERILYAADPLRGGHDPVEVVSPCFFDKDGSRMHV
ncbi:sarcosine oxidase subunit alpha family protein [Denitrobaculum tricleocarpae]|uniref:Sarcosine oxidase subunit alpha family protein n=1 Tax=Denitrobaculum tricleocarpae TaxID=2591009 RepID=A0A545U1F3_9PROT|nr:sarcosine oxidase subunit alpha family protein [Denitrobaculum tricleocarpae]TQV83300.1 sarcosine oxidase subunit alpha family protein [Denitrobaculum tricleocarpae]